nr:reverse transcriptase domain-containing protein [Tanacetum cinerariifolium]
KSERKSELVSVVMSADFAVTYSSVHSEARSWSIPFEDPYEEAAQQLFEQAPHSPEYVPRDHVPVFVPEFEHPEDLVPAEGEADTPPQNMPLLATPRPGCEVGESSAAAARRQGPAMAHGVDCSYMDTRLQDTERRMMAALELVNRRVSKINVECYRARYRKEGDGMQHFEDWIRGNLSERCDLMPVELGSFDAIIGMDWLRRHHAMIMCNEKLVRVPFGNETLVFRGAESYIRRESRLTVTPCFKVREYRAKGCHVFLAQISAAQEDDDW